MSVTLAPGPIGLEDLAAWTGGELRVRAGSGASAAVSGASIDTRTLQPGELFVPLAGEHTDGHAFLGRAFERGAAAALCLRGPAEALRGTEPGPLVVVADVTAALQAIAARHRARWDGLLIGVTGSAGKTTTKDLVAAALDSDRPTLRTEGNLNNHWGVPLTLLRLSPEHAAAVVEMGMNQPGEIAMLSALSRPQAAVITLVGAAHIELFGSVEAIAREKTALVRALPPGAPVFAGADSPPLMAALAGAPQRVITYGFSPAARMHPRVFEDLGPDGSRLEVDGFPPCHLRLVGRHHAANALAAFAVAREYRLDPARVVVALAAHVPGKARMEVRGISGATLLVDCYNSNPDSARAALQTLERWPSATRRIAVLGDMLELGSQSARLHAEVGASVRGAELWVLGAHAADVAAGAAGQGTTARRFASMSDVQTALREALAPGVVVLLKASRGVALERVLDGLEGD
jgi:UDP-N-acetylmuramoyl-tripeptide--D-alanyl-D-alanine ligase